MNKHYTIRPAGNGYIIGIYKGKGGGGLSEELVARSWVEVLEILTEIKAPDFQQAEVTG